MIKKRDFWMPFAPAVLLEAASKYLRVPRSLPARGSPWMMHTFDSTERRGEFVAGVHSYDRTARAQTVVREMSPEFYRLIERFAGRKQKEVVLNTSFNLHGFPIVLGARDAMHVMVNSSLEYLVINDLLVTKKDRAPVAERGTEQEKQRKKLAKV
jgi:carbamoyltransferase